MHTGDVCGVTCVWCVPVVCALCMCTGGPGLRCGQDLGGSSSGAQVGVLTLSGPPTPPHPPAGWRPRSCAAGIPSSSGRPRLPGSGAGVQRRDGERGVGSQSKGGGVSTEGWGHLAAWAGGGRVARSLQSQHHQKTPQDVMMRSRSWEFKVGARGGGPTFPLRPRLESRALWERHPSTSPLRPPRKRLRGSSLQSRTQ